MRWERNIAGLNDEVQAPNAVSGYRADGFIFLILTSPTLGFFAGERILPRIDGAEISNITMTRDQEIRDRKSDVLMGAKACV